MNERFEVKVNGLIVATVYVHPDGDTVATARDRALTIAAEACSGQAYKFEVAVRLVWEVSQPILSVRS